MLYVLVSSSPSITYPRCHYLDLCSATFVGAILVNGYALLTLSVTIEMRIETLKIALKGCVRPCWSCPCIRIEKYVLLTKDEGK